MANRFRFTVRLMLLLPLLSPCSGCAVLSLATVGAALDAVGSAAAVGSDVYHLGKLSAVLPDSDGECHRAALAAGADLDLRVSIDTLADAHNGVWEMTLHDDLKDPVGVHIERRTPRLSRCRIDVGLFGSEPTATLFIERMRAHLHKLPTTAP